MKKYLYGIELESFIPEKRYDKFCEKIIELVPEWEIDDDSSISHDHNEEGMELKFAGPLNYKDAKRAVKRVATLCKNRKVKVNDSCGYHLHMSHKDMEKPKKIERIIKLWLSIEDFLYSTQPINRTKNTYCKRKLHDYVLDEDLELPKQKIELMRKLRYTNRYYALNMKAIDDHGTIEIRLHAGTVDRDEIINWLDLMTKFFDYALADSYDHKKVHQLFQMEISPIKTLKIYNLLDIPDKLRIFYNRKIHKSSYRALNREKRAGEELIKLKIEERKILKGPAHLRDKRMDIIWKKRKRWEGMIQTRYKDQY